MSLCYRLIVFFLCFSLALISKETDSEDLSTIEFELSADCEPLTVVAGCVNVESGQFFQTGSDFKGNTIDPLCINRFYDSGSTNESFLGLGFSTQFPLYASKPISEFVTRHTFFAMFSLRDSYLIPFIRGLENRYKVSPRIYQKGYTNTNGFEISGKTNIINCTGSYISSKDNSKWVIKLGDGTIRTYGCREKLSKEKRIEMNFPTKYIYLLTEEIKPNGNKLVFDYKILENKQVKPRLEKVSTFNRNGNLINYFKISYSPVDAICVARSSCGQAIVYSQPVMKCENKDFYGSRKVLQSINSSQKGVAEFQYSVEKGSFPYMKKIKKEAGRFLSVKYYPSPKRKVQTLAQPFGPNNASIATYNFCYNEKSTDVFNALNEQTTYRFDSNRRLSKIDHLDNGQVVKQEAFEWNVIEGIKGWLAHKSIQVGAQVYYQQRYHYDQQGNVTSKILFGNISGEKPDFFNVHDKYKMDSYVVNSTYSKDGFNLLTQRSFPSGLTHLYEYLPQTNLCTKELICYSGSIKERIFRYYDENGQLNRIIEDDLNHPDSMDTEGITYRRLKIIDSVKGQLSPSFGKPHIIKEVFYDFSKGQYVLLKSTELSYDGFGNETSKKISDSKGFCYELVKSYDSRGRVVYESDAMGHITSYKYDESDNKIEEEVIGSGKITYKNYDCANRLIKKIEQLESGEIFTTTYAYDLLGRCICETDTYGNQTSYTYDRFGNQTGVIKAAILDGLGNVIYPTLRKEYNILGQVVSETDENNFTTHYSYNIYGKPTHIRHPDGSTERFVYYVAGWLKQHWHEDGTSHYYEYNPKGSLIKEVFFDQAGTAVKIDEYGYKGSLLAFHKNARGVFTFFEYDGAGRKIKEVSEEKTVSYLYDDLDRMIKVCRFINENEVQEEIYDYDWLDRVTLKILQDSQGHTYAKEAYDYDLHGNKIKKTFWELDENQSIYHSQYNPKNLILAKEDPLGHRIHFNYNYDQLNSIGQRVQTMTQKDALDRPIIETHNALGLVEKREVYEGELLLSSLHFKYDGSGKLIEQKALVMSEGKFLREYSIAFTYNCRGLVESETELPHGKRIGYVYDARGRIIKKQKPDAVVLYYNYDLSGYLERLFSSDNTIDYRYVNDLEGCPVEIHDQIRGTVQKRAYDNYGRLIQDHISQDLCINYEYDRLDRVTALILPDQSSIRYHYDAFHLRKIQRYNVSDKERYVCHQLEYDLRGRLRRTKSPVTEISYAYDFLGRAIRIETPLWKSALKQFDPVGNLCIQQQKDRTSDRNLIFAYDRFNQLTQDEDNTFSYDSLGNCIKVNEHTRQINDLNQIENDGQSLLAYDLNGNLIYQQDPPITCHYDALDRLISYTRQEKTTTFTYDSFNRCLSITNANGTKHLLYQKDQDIGCIANNKIQELRVINPIGEQTFAIELNEKVYFPIQDHRYNICALQEKEGSLAQWSRYSAFGDKKTFGNLSIHSPWGFSNRREVEGLVQFSHRFYYPKLMRWLTPDPIGFKDGLNLYRYVKNNPHTFRDPDGRFAFFLLVAAFGVGETIVTMATINVIINTVLVGAIGCIVYDIAQKIDNKLNSAAEGSLEESADTNEVKRHDPDQEALNEFAKERKKQGVTNSEADTLLEWSNEYNFPARDDRGKDHWIGGEHIHLGGKHIPICQ